MILVEKEEGMRWLIRRLEKYFDGKELVLNTEKTKVIRLRKKGEEEEGN